MEMMIVSTLVMIIVKIFMMFEKKMIVLMSLETMMLITILSYSLEFLSTSSSQFTLILLTIFMVLDSTMGISILISSSRNSSSKLMKLNMI